MNSNLFANPQLFQAYNNDPRLAMAQGLMQQGASTAPVRSPLEGLARALTAGLGGFQAGQVRKGYQGQDDKYRAGLAEALKGGDVIGALSSSNEPMLQQLALDAKMRQALDPAKDPLLQVYDPNTKSMVYKPQSQAAGQQAAAPELPKAPTTRQVGDPNRAGVLLDQQFNPQTGQWETVGQRLPEPKATNATPDKIQIAISAGLKPGTPEWTAFLTGDKENSKAPSAKDLRDEYGKGLKEYNEALNGFNKVVAAAKDTSPAGDLAMIFGFMKTLDPSSTVREGEFATAQNAGSVPTQIQSLYNRIISGERLTSQQRGDFVNTAQGQFATYQERKKLADEYYTGLATRNGLSPQDVLVPYPSPAALGGDDTADMPDPGAGEMTATGPGGQKLILRNGQWVPQ